MLEQLKRDRWSQVLLALVALAGLVACCVIGSGLSALSERNQPRQVEQVPAPSILPPVDTPVSATTFTLSGTGQTATELFNLNQGLARFELFHDGEHNFAVILMTEQGKTTELLVNEIGPFTGSKAVQIRQPGRYLLDITADGNWSVIISN